jgi:hypothetical protein
MLRYAGIGSRSTPSSVCDYIRTELAPKLCREGWKLLSGGAEGADQAFAHHIPAEMKEIYVVDLGLEKDASVIYAPRLSNWRRAIDTMWKYRPKPEALKSNRSRGLISRNAYQVLGLSLKEPVDMIVCWTPNGAVTGGTGQALRIAQDFNIPVYNLGDKTLDPETIGKKERLQHLQNEST